MNSSSITHLTPPTLQPHDDWIHAMPTSEAEHHPYIAGRIAVIHSEIQRLARSTNIRNPTNLLNISADAIAAHQEDLSSSLSNFTSYNASNSTAVINDLRQAYHTIVAVTARHHDAAMATPTAAAQAEPAEEKARDSDSSKDSLEGAFSGASDLPPRTMSETPEINPYRRPRNEEAARQMQTLPIENVRLATSSPGSVGEPFLERPLYQQQNSPPSSSAAATTRPPHRSSPSDHDTVLMGSTRNTPSINDSESDDHAG